MLPETIEAIPEAVEASKFAPSPQRSEFEDHVDTSRFVIDGVDYIPDLSVLGSSYDVTLKSCKNHNRYAIIKNTGEIPARTEAAWQTIDEYRSTVDGMEPLGDLVPKYNDGRGTVSFLLVKGDLVYGVNSSVRDKQADALCHKYHKKLLTVPDTKMNIHYGWGAAQIFTHAEAASLITAYEQYGDQLGTEVTIYVDRKTCNFCRSFLPELMQYIGVEKLTIVNKNNTIIVLTTKSKEANYE